MKAAPATRWSAHAFPAVPAVRVGVERPVPRAIHGSVTGKDGSRRDVDPVLATRASSPSPSSEVRPGEAVRRALQSSKRLGAELDSACARFPSCPTPGDLRATRRVIENPRLLPRGRSLAAWSSRRGRAACASPHANIAPLGAVFEPSSSASLAPRRRRARDRDSSRSRRAAPDSVTAATRRATVDLSVSRRRGERAREDGGPGSSSARWPGIRLVLTVRTSPRRAIRTPTAFYLLDRMVGTQRARATARTGFPSEGGGAFEGVKSRNVGTKTSLALRRATRKIVVPDQIGPRE